MKLERGNILEGHKGQQCVPVARVLWRSAGGQGAVGASWRCWERLSGSCRKVWVWYLGINRDLSTGESVFLYSMAFDR